MNRTYAQMRLELGYDAEGRVEIDERKGKCVVLKSNNAVVLPYYSRKSANGFFMTSPYRITGARLDRRLEKPSFINLEAGSDYPVTFAATMMLLTEELEKQNMPHVQGYPSVDHLKFNMEDRIQPLRDEIFRQLLANGIDPDSNKLYFWLRMWTPEHSGD